jgi:hypothetical protein
MLHVAVILVPEDGQNMTETEYNKTAVSGENV